MQGLQLMSWKDFVIFPVYIVIILIIVNSISKKIPENNKLRVYFKWGIYLRIITSFIFVLVHEFVYGGDTGSYFIYGSKLIWEAFFESPSIAFNLLFNSDSLNLDAQKYVNRMYLDFQGPEGIIMRISAFIGFFTFHTYSTIALILSLFCFSGLWASFRVVQQLYPAITKKLALAFLFLPSVVFWSSGILKDPLTLGALGWLFWATYQIGVKKKKIFKSVLVAAFMFLLILNIKIYILLSFLPPAMLWVFNYNSGQIKSKAIKLIAKPFLLILGGAVSFLGVTSLTEENSKYDIENFSKQTAINSYYLNTQTGSGSSYFIDVFDGSILSFLEVAPQAVNVALYRPYLWEVKNPFMLLSAFEALFMLFLTIQLFFKTGILKTIRLIFTNPLISFCIVFSFIFAFGVGTNSGNFGTLVRYKIPLLPFFLAGLNIAYFESIKLKLISRIQLKRPKKLAALD